MAEGRLEWIRALQLNPGACQDYREWTAKRLAAAQLAERIAPTWEATLAERARCEVWAELQRIMEFASREEKAHAGKAQG